MKVQLRDIVVAVAEIERLTSGRARAKESFQLALARRGIDVILDEYYKARGEATKSHATRDETKVDSYHFYLPQSPEEAKEGEPRLVDVDAFDAYTEEHNELLDGEVEIDASITIALIDKAKIDPPMTPVELARLWWLIEGFRQQE